MDWNTFVSALLGTAVPALIVSIVMLVLTHRTNKALESHRNMLAEKLSRLENKLSVRASMFSVWHQRRVTALVDIYEAFRLYLDFLRRALYLPPKGVNMDPMWDFRTAVDCNLVFLDDGLQRQVQVYVGELLTFWNWAHEQQRSADLSEQDPVRDRLDHEIPLYLEKLRQVINSYADPEYGAHEPVARSNNGIQTDNAARCR